MWTFGSLCWTQMFSKRCPFCLPFTIRNPQMGANLKIFKQSRKSHQYTSSFSPRFSRGQSTICIYLPWILLCCIFHGSNQLPNLKISFGQDGCLSSLPLQYGVAHCADTIGASWLNRWMPSWTWPLNKFVAGWISPRMNLETSTNGGFVIAFLSWRVLYLATVGRQEKVQFVLFRSKHTGCSWVKDTAVI